VPGKPVNRPAAGVCGVQNVDEVVVREVRVEGDPERAALALGVDVVDRQRRRRKHLAVLINAYPAWALGEKQAAVGRERQAPRNLEIGCEDLYAELHAVGGRELIVDAAANRWRRLSALLLIGLCDDERGSEHPPAHGGSKTPGGSPSD